MYYDNELTNKTIYDYKSARRLKGFFIQVLILLDKRRKNPNKPNHYLDPHWDYAEIEQIIQLLEMSPSQNLELDPQTNNRVIEIYGSAKKHYYSRVMNMYRYYQDTDKMIMGCNGMDGSVRNSMLLLAGRPKLKAA